MLRPVTVTLEDAREKGELQRAYYSLLLAVASNGLSVALLKVPPASIEAIMVALTRGAATHVDAGVRRTCLLVGGPAGRGGEAAGGGGTGWDVGGGAACKLQIAFAHGAHPQRTCTRCSTHLACTAAYKPTLHRTVGHAAPSHHLIVGL